jgi:tetratricopeptide (TPR) repeat protein
MIRSPEQLTKASFGVLVDALVRMHLLSRVGKFESPEAEAVRDSTEEPWDELTIAERRHIVELSADLNSLEENLDQTASDIPSQALQEAYEARQAGDWDRALERIRQADPRATSPIALYFRGTIWAARGLNHVATLFFDRAAALAPDSDNYRAAALNALAQSNPSDAIGQAEQILVQAEDSGLRSLVVALAVVFSDSIGRSPEERSGIRKRLIPLLEKALSRLEEKREAPILRAKVLMQLTACYSSEGRIEAAIASVSRAIQYDPESDLAYIARAKLTLGTSQFDLSDFERAVELSTTDEVPYVFLAQHYAVTKQFEDVLVICRRAEQLNVSDTARSMLLNSRAIAEAELGLVSRSLRSFEEALRKDPSNEYVGQNLKLMQDAIARSDKSPSSWERPTERSLVPSL